MILKGLVDPCTIKVYSASHKSLPQKQYSNIATLTLQNLPVAQLLTQVRYLSVLIKEPVQLH